MNPSIIAREAGAVVQNQELAILKGQMIATILSIIPIIIGVILIYNQEQILQEKEEILTNKQAQNLLLFSKLLVIGIIFYFLTTNISAYREAKENDQETRDLLLQVGASFLTSIAATLSLFVVLGAYDSLVTFPEVENTTL